MEFNKLLNTKDRKSNRNYLRRNSTPAEKGLWNLLKNHQVDGLKFRRQYSIGSYIVDFYCPQIRLSIELDGQVHIGNEIYDEQRSKFIQEKTGIYIMRFENRIVFEDPEGILNEIREYVEKYATNSL